MYLHALDSDGASFTKDEMQAGYAAFITEKGPQCQMLMHAFYMCLFFREFVGNILNMNRCY
jgi:hypothetical protein